MDAIALQTLRDEMLDVFVHAYELELDPEKLALLLKYARRVVERLPELVETFIRRVAEQQNIELP